MAMSADAPKYNQYGCFSSEELARIDCLECELDHAKSGAMEIIVEHLERGQIGDLIDGVCENKLSLEDLDQLVAVLRAMHMVRHELMAWAKERVPSSD